MLQIYLYSAVAGGLAIFYVATLLTIDGLLRLWTGLDASEETRKLIAIGLGFATVAGPLWWLHWQWLSSQISQERRPVGMIHSYRAYLFTILLLAVFAVFGSGGVAVTSLAGLALNVEGSVIVAWIRVGVALSTMLFSALLWVHHWRRLEEVNQHQGNRILHPHSQRALAS